MVEEELLGVLDDLVVGEHAAAIGFNVELVDVELAADAGPTRFESLGILRVQRASDGDVDDRLEALFESRGAGGG